MKVQWLVLSAAALRAAVACLGAEARAAGCSKDSDIVLASMSARVEGQDIGGVGTLSQFVIGGGRAF